MSHPHLPTTPAGRASRVRHGFYLTTALLAVLLLVGCGSSGLGDIFGGDDGRVDDRVSEVSGTVRYVDTANRTIELERVDYRHGLADGDERSRIYYDADTVVEHEGRTYRPEALEAGDEIVASVDDTGRDLVAERIRVTYDVTSVDRRDGTYDRSDDRYDSTLADLRGIVRYVDTRDRTIELERVDYARSFDRRTSGDRDRIVLQYDARTRVEFEGQLYGPENLEVGDEVAVEVSEVGNRYLVDEIEVIRDVRERYGR